MASTFIDISAELSNYNDRETVFERFAKDMKKITKKNVYSDFSFPKCGKVLGIIRHILMNPKHQSELLKITKMKKGELEFFRDNAGNTAYLSQTGEIIKSKEMDIERTRAIVKLMAERLKITIEDEDILSEITEERWKEISKLSMQRAKRNKKALQDVKTDIIPEE